MRKKYLAQYIANHNISRTEIFRYFIDSNNTNFGHPDVYIESNIIGFYNILEACRHNPVDHLVYASSSSVYGGNKKVRAGVLPVDYDFESHYELVGMQAGDVPVTYADSEALERDYGFTPRIGIREGLRAFAEWFVDYEIYASLKVAGRL